MVKKLPFPMYRLTERNLLTPCALVILTIFFSSSRIFAQAQLLKDINTTKEPYYSEIMEFTNVDTVTFFISHNELWKTDGMGTNTIRLKTFKSLRSLTAVGSNLYFAADDGTSGLELWKSDGTATGTTLVRDINPGAAGSNPLDLIDANGIAYFTADNGTHGREAWKSNGVASGTVMIKDIIPGASSSGANSLTFMNGIVYFQANDNVNGYELWRTDGTSAGTRMVKNIRTGTMVSSSPTLLTDVNGTLFFVAQGNTTGRELWKSDGTGAGTVLVKDIMPGSGSSSIENTTNVNGILYFSANNGTTGKELWKSDGTAGGTVLVKEMRPGTAGADGDIPMGQFKTLGGQLYFVASEGQYGFMGLYTTDGTAAGTKRLIYLTPIESVGYNLQLTYFNGMLYFFNGDYLDDGYVQRLVKINPDGTGFAAVKHVAKDFYAQTFPAKMIAGSNYLLLSARLSATAGWQLVRSDGTNVGTVGVKDTYVTTTGSAPYNFVTVHNVTYFIARTSAGSGLYRTNGTPSGTTALLTGFYQIRSLTQVGNRLFFFGVPTSGGGEALYKVENAASTPVLLKDGLSDSYLLTAVGDVAYFAEAHYTPHSNSLWRSDGTVPGTVELASFYNVKNIFNYNGTAMLGILNNAGLELWKSNGTAASTVKITDMTTSTLRHYELRPYGTTGGIYYFGLEDGTHGFEPWRTDGTATGTFMIEDLRAGDTSFPMDYDIAGSAIFRDTLYFSAKDAAGDWALFKTGSTVGSVEKVAGLDGAGVVLTALPDNLMIFTATADNRSHLWTSNGTLAGTEHLTDLGPPLHNIDPVVMGNVMYFNASANSAASEFYLIPTPNESLWRSDGTACGTFYIDIGAYRPLPMEALGTQLIFSGYTVKTGAEPYAYNTTLAPGSPCTSSSTTIAARSDVRMTSDNEEALAFAPNPFTGELKVVIHGQSNEKARMIIYSISGSPIETMNDVEVNREYTVGQQWPIGVYIMKVNVGTKTVVEKVIKR